MKIYVNEKGEIKDVNFTSDTTLTELEVTDGTFDGWTIAKILCYKVSVKDGNVVMLTPYLDSRIVEHIDKLGVQTEKTDAQVLFTALMTDTLIEEEVE